MNCRHAASFSSLACATKALIDDKALQLQMGRQARQLSEGWSWETATAKLRNIQYRTAIKLHRSRDVVTGQSHKEIENAILKLKEENVTLNDRIAENKLKSGQKIATISKEVPTPAYAD
jgi:hypothetical protein